MKRPKTSDEEHIANKCQAMALLQFPLNVEGSGASESTAKKSTDRSVSAVILTVLSQAPEDGYLMISNESSIRPIKKSGAVHGDLDLLIGSYSKRKKSSLVLVRTVMGETNQ